MGDWGLKISKDGEDVKTAADKDLLFTTKHNTLKIHTTRKDTIAGSGGTLTIAHGFSYIPMFVVFINNSGWKPLTGYSSANAYIDSTNLIITNNFVANKEFRTMIFIDKLKD